MPRELCMYVEESVLSVSSFSNLESAGFDVPIFHSFDPFSSISKNPSAYLTHCL